MQQTKPRFGRLLRPPAWKQSGTNVVERDGQKKKIGHNCKLQFGIQ